MKPSAFKKILYESADIPDEIKAGILSPEKLNLYNELMQSDEILSLPKGKLDNFLKNLFSEWNSDKSEASAQLEIIPQLVKKGVDLELLSQLDITHKNKNQTEFILKKFAQIWQDEAEKITKEAKLENLDSEELSHELLRQKNY